MKRGLKFYGFLSFVVVGMLLTASMAFGGGLTISGDNVGIGTTTPITPLHVEGGDTFAIYGKANFGGVRGESVLNYGVSGISSTGIGVFGDSDAGIGVYGRSNSYWAGYFYGPVFVFGNQTIDGGGSLNVEGNITTTTGSFTGDGSGLMNLNGANITAGTVGAGALATGAVATSNIADGAVTAAKINSTGLDADTVDGQHSADIISAASDEVRTPITSLPFEISSSGSYYLTGNLTATGDGITVNADNVTIDFNGFTITGPGKISGMGYGVRMYNRKDVEIKNGTVRDFGFQGIYESGFSGKGHRIIHMRVEDNGGSTYDGIQLNGEANLVRDCALISNGSYGIYAGSGSIMIGNIANDNGSRGIYAGGGSTVSVNTAKSNGGIGIYAGDGSSISGNTAISNVGNGISAGAGSTVSGNTAGYNSNNGISGGDGSTISGNTAKNNVGDGIASGFDSMISGNTASHNSQNGIVAVDGSMVKNNTANYNSWNGINLGGNQLVDGNTAYLNNQSAGSYVNMTPCASCTITSSNHAP